MSGLFVGWFVCWLVGWLVGWLSDCLTFQKTKHIANCSQMSSLPGALRTHVCAPCPKFRIYIQSRGRCNESLSCLISCGGAV
jgi:hypothetical protein